MILGVVVTSLHHFLCVLRQSRLAKFFQAVPGGRAGLMQASGPLAFFVAIAGILVAVCHVSASFRH